MTVFFFWILFAIAVGVFASNKGRSGFGWFLLSVLISPFLGLLFCAISSDLKNPAMSGSAQPGADTHVKCPACAEWVLPEAISCRHCRHPLTPDGNFSTSRANSKKAAQSEDSKNLLIGTGFIVLLFVLAGGISKFL